MPPLMHHPLPFTSGHPYNSTLLLSADHFINISTIISSIKKKKKKNLDPTSFFSSCSFFSVWQQKFFKRCFHLFSLFPLLLSLESTWDRLSSPLQAHPCPPLETDLVKIIIDFHFASHSQLTVSSMCPPCFLLPINAMITCQDTIISRFLLNLAGFFLSISFLILPHLPSYLLTMEYPDAWFLFLSIYSPLKNSFLLMAVDTI